MASPLPSIDSTGVTRVFADFIGTMGSSDSSKVCDRGFRILPSRGCLPAAMSHDEAVRHILEASGTQFDPIVVEAFLRKQKAIERLATHLSNQKPAAKRIRAVQAVSATMNVEQTPATTISPAVTEPARRD